MTAADKGELFILLFILFTLILLNKIARSKPPCDHISLNTNSSQLRKRRSRAEKYASVNLVPFSYPVHTYGCQSFDGRGCLKNTAYVKLPKCFLRVTGNLVAILCCSYREFKCPLLGFFLFLPGQKPEEYAEVHPTAKWLSPALLAGYMLFTNVLLLNLLIAIFR